MADEEYAICPYNEFHHIRKSRMPQHLVKCRKNYEGLPLETCAFNATHLVRPEEMEKHLRDCEAYHSFNRPNYLKLMEKRS